MLGSSSISRLIDHSLLKPEASASQIAEAARVARDLDCACICVNSSRVKTALLSDGVPVCSVVGFPFGASVADAKAIEASAALDSGASEIDMVVNIGALIDRDHAVVRDDIERVRRATRGATLKVILESALLSTPQLVEACRIAVDAGADFVKTSTGFHPAGGATVEAVRTMRQTVGPDVGVKASGGIRDLETARAMVAAGATRLGLGATASVLGEQPREAP